MADTIQCDEHGESPQAFVCTHLAAGGAGLGFNRNAPDDENPFPDAWCDDCEIIRAAGNGWDEESEKLAEIKLLCAECYELARIRNTRPEVTLDDLSGLRWKCGSCEEWHTGPMVDVAYAQPDYWRRGYERGSRWGVLPSGSIEKSHSTFLDDDYCAINDGDFFVRGVIELPIFGSVESFNWGVWGSLSLANFEALLKAEEDSNSVVLTPMFSWLSNQISDYPDTLNLKMYAHPQGGNRRSRFRLEPSDHPLAQEFQRGITPARVREIMLGRLPAMDR